MVTRYTKSPKSTTLHFDTKEQAIRLAADLLRIADKAEFPGSGVTIFEKPKIDGKQQTATVAVLAARRRKKTQ